jgi:phosphate:Na+ symporter
VVGFVGAGLITFRDALGIIFGASVGTTLTGWIVAVVGVKLALGTVLTPVVLVGALAWRFGQGRVSDAGRAAAGFGLLFMGISALQAGLGEFGSILSPDRFPGDSLVGRLELVAIGAVITLVTQSSSAGVAMAITALGAGAITLPQSAALVIGMHIGTASTAAIAATGASTATRRTGLAHLIFNTLTGVLAFGLLWPATWVFDRAVIAPEFALTLFHTAFCVIGAAVMLVFTDAFARLVIALVPDRGPNLTGQLDRAVQSDAAAAMDAAHAAISAIAEALFARVGALLRGQPSPAHVTVPGLAEIVRAIDQTLDFVERIPIADGGAGRTASGQLAALHALDHLARLASRCGQTERAMALVREPGLADGARRLATALPPAGTPWEAARDTLAEVWRGLHEDREGVRTGLIAAAAEGRLSAHALTARLDAARWLYRSSYHVWRIAHHLSPPDGPETPESETAEG